MATGKGKKPKGEPPGIRLSGSYVVTLADGTRGTITKFGCRHYLNIKRDRMKLTRVMKRGKR
jgi:hypothetical protein